MNLAMAMGATDHYRVEGIHRRHFIETAGAAGLSKSTAKNMIEEIMAAADDAVTQLADELPPRFPKAIHSSVSRAIGARLRVLWA